ncbi:uncharacterized protein LOC123217731 isoform X2 [Mangifera indica]|uniref:uncharacterized protein LOC123217731 isoform X2 n=1 Tax=Mangifera indica TaxID=29780 RepID=UPI001CFA5CE3|nr:uncharacterized protein LOC123217731 isoform X2 [Mangifera indica]XP_044494785.1 uncharacterized protein LOC123217731 isoform X2 [Mangifera indica]XP_044494786.1 uncharacterized protein LOC123217731 isoform X2 [Mangifera indica]
MKFGNEQVFAQSTLDHKADSKPFDYQDNPLEFTRLKSGNGIVKEYQNGVLCDSKPNAGDADKLSYMKYDADGWTATKLDHSMNLKDRTNDNEKDFRDRAAQHSEFSRETESFEDSDFYMDKSVMECELPELIVCYKDSTYHVKDICIDEGVPSPDRILFDNDIDEKGVCSLLNPENNRNDEVMEEKINTVMPLLEVLKSPTENDPNMDTVNQYVFPPEPDSDKYTVGLCDSKDLLLTDKVKDDETDEAAAKKFSLGDLLSMKDLTTENSYSKFSSNCKTETENQQGFDGKSVLACTAFVSLTTESNGGTKEEITMSTDLVSGATELNNGSEEAVLANHTMVSANEGKHDDSKEATSASFDLASGEAVLANTALVSSANESNCGTEEGELATSDNVSAAEESNQGSQEGILENKALVSGDEEKQNEATLASHDLVSGSEELTKVRIDEKLLYNSKVETGGITSDFDASAFTGRGTEECSQNGNFKQIGTPDSSKLADAPRLSVSSQVRNDLGESSFSGTGPVSGLITYSGPIAYSGSLSLRSDSSTASARSFAFPILQSEWNSSPVKMAKADRRHLQKHKCWRQGLLCCRF